MTTTQTRTDAQPFDDEAAQEFAGRVLTVFDDACISLLISVGHQAGLFDTLAGMPAATSEEVARAAGLDERYVREWLDGMTTARVLRHDPDGRTYRLPAEHAAVLTRAAGPENLAPLTQFVPLLGAVEPEILGCFRSGGGLPYSAYPRFHRLMAENSAQAGDAGLVDLVVPLVPGLPERLHTGIDVLDVGCGRGHAVNLLGQAFPASRFTGYDFSEEAIAWARDEAAELGLANVRFAVLDVATMDHDARFDLVTAFDAIHDQAEPAAVLSATRRALRPGGSFLMVDIKASSDVLDNVDVPWGTFLYTVSLMHCMPVSLGLGGAGLGTAWGRQLATAMLSEAGFADVAVHEIETDPINSYYVAGTPLDVGTA